MNVQGTARRWHAGAAIVFTLGVAAATAGCAGGAASTATAPPTAAATGQPTSAVPPATAVPATTTVPPATAVPSATAARPTTAPPTTAATPVATTVPPTLGVQWGPGGQQGYGHVRPVTVFNGGDPTGLVQHITWTSWGGETATGTGISYYDGPGQTVAQSTAQRASIVAFDLGTCGGHPAYQAVEWFFPQHGGKFSATTYINDCTGQYVSQI